MNMEVNMNFMSQLKKRLLIAGSCGSWLLLLFLLSCQTTARVPDAFRIDASSAPLKSGAAAYIFADVKEARKIIEIIPIRELRDRNTRMMLDRTNFVAAAVYPAESGQRFHLAAWGKYPNSRAGMALGANKNWRKINSPSGGFWHSQTDKLSIAISPRHAFAASSLSDEPLDPVISSQNVQIPEGFNAFRSSNKGAPLSCWLGNPASSIDTILSQTGLPFRAPVQNVFINLFSLENDKYEAVIRFQFSGDSQARGLASILNLARGFASGTSNLITSIFLANPPVQNGVNLDFKSAPLSERELSLLFQIFLL